MHLHFLLSLNYQSIHVTQFMNISRVVDYNFDDSSLKTVSKGMGDGKLQVCDILHLAFLLAAKKTDAMPGSGIPSWNHKSVSQAK